MFLCKLITLKLRIIINQVKKTIGKQSDFVKYSLKKNYREDEEIVFVLINSAEHAPWSLEPVNSIKEPKFATITYSLVFLIIKNVISFQFPTRMHNYEPSLQLFAYTKSLEKRYKMIIFISFFSSPYTYMCVYNSKALRTLTLIYHCRVNEEEKIITRAKHVTTKKNKSTQ